MNPSVQISLNRIGNKEISTVLLYRFDNEPKTWETCIFEDNGNSDVVARYATEAEAITGHNQIFMNEITAEV